ncbi:MAG TPA: ATP-binding cassette domain-containing protein [Bdellovibrionota bacterium]|jgi:macrolide transport system ATP-binding/permease protein|nr:ATP-binding cassette domain-containing protein [Bdellovibrionota bacterium]
MSSTPLIEVRDLKFYYRPGEWILKGISFAIHEGEFVAVTGPSGSGKSTLFYLLGCLLDKYKGQVYFRGDPTRSRSPNERAWLRNREIGFVFQQFYLLPRSTVMENILLPTYFPFDESKPSQEDRERVTAIAERLGIAHLLQRSPQELSGGQQQRVAIARALLRKAELILADEPTGNLDSKSSESVMELLKELHREGHTVVIVTHSPEIAAQCTRVIHVRDGVLEKDVINPEGTTPAPRPPSALNAEVPRESISEQSFRGLGVGSFLKSLPIAWNNIKRSRTKSALTMLGVSLGVAAVLTTMSLGAFAKEKILQGYQALGINTLRFVGYENWMRSSNDFTPATFREFSLEKDIMPLRKIFDEIEAVSPLLDLETPKFEFGGRDLDENTAALGVSEQYFAVTGQSIAEGRALSVFDVASGAPVCVIGAEVKDRLFPDSEALNRSVSVNSENASIAMNCIVVGVLVRQPSSQDAVTPNTQVFLPYTYFSKSATHPQYRELHQFLIKIRDGVDPAAMGPRLEGYFYSRYGSSGQFNAASDAKLISQMKMFLNVFSGLLSAVAIIALVVGGVGINNMMLASLSERLKELGLRKALGATPRQLRYLMLGESILLCTAAGIIGLVVGFVAYQGLVVAATKLIPKLQYEWIFEPAAFLISFVAIFLTGLFSGFIPAMKAEKLDVMEALRQDI